MAIADDLWTDLARRDCSPIASATEPMSDEALTALLEIIGPGWSTAEDQRLTKTFTFENFRQALEFINHVGELAETQQHHPDLHLSWGKVKVQVWTHAAGGLTENDFILAAKIDQI